MLNNMTEFERNYLLGRLRTAYYVEAAIAIMTISTMIASAYLAIQGNYVAAIFYAISSVIKSCSFFYMRRWIVKANNKLNQKE